MGAKIRRILCKLNKIVPHIPASTDVWSYSMLWAEEAGALATGSREWSFGDGATGGKGIPVSDGTEITEIFFHADSYSSTGKVTVECQDIQVMGSPVTLASISLTSSTDGGGQTGNARKITTFPTPISVPSGAVLGFRTIQKSGTVSDARVGIKIRHDKQVITL